MPNRILKETICTSETINALTWQLEVLWYRLLVQCDDYGRMDARPAIVRAKCFPLRLDQITDDDVAQALATFQDIGLIHLYTVDGKRYLQVTTWDKHQQVRARRSKFPAPAEGMQSDDINSTAHECTCNHVISDDINCKQAISRKTSKAPEQVIADDINCNQAKSSDSICTRNPNPNPIVSLVRAREGWDEIMEAYMQLTGGTPGSVDLDTLDEYYDSLGPEMVLKAFEVSQGKARQFRYVAKVLERWHGKGFATVEDIERDQAEFQASLRPKPRTRRPQPDEPRYNIPDAEESRRMMAEWRGEVKASG